MEHRDVFLIEVIIDFCDRIIKSLQSPQISYEEFFSNLDLIDVSSFRVLQIGENVNNLSDRFKDAHPEIPWHKIAGLRNLVAHEYGDIEPEKLWQTITTDIPVLRDFCAEQIGSEK